MKTVKKKYRIKAPVEAVWEALVDPKAINRWGGGPAKMSARKGAKFSLWGGSIYGKNVAVVPNKKLVQKWNGGDWEKLSDLTFTLKKAKTGTDVTLVHKNVPDKEAKNISAGWDDYYMIPLKKYVESKK